MESTKKSIGKKQLRWLLWGSLISFSLVVFFHFGYDRTGFYPLSFVCATNESLWEHMKILFFGSLAFNGALYFALFRRNANFIAGLVAGLSFIVVSVPAIVLAYTAILGYEIFIVDFILSFIVQVVCQFIILGFLKSSRDYTRSLKLAVSWLVLLLVLFVVFRLFPPGFGIFLPPEGLSA